MIPCKVSSLIRKVVHSIVPRDRDRDRDRDREEYKGESDEEAAVAGRVSADVSTAGTARQANIH
jgi:hypothetical protein